MQSNKDEQADKGGNLETRVGGNLETREADAALPEDEPGAGGDLETRGQLRVGGNLETRGEDEGEIPSQQDED